MITAKQYAEILNQFLEEVGEEDVNKAIKAFIGLLKKNNDLRLADKIIEEYQNAGIKQVRVTSAKRISESAKKELQKLGDVKEGVDTSLIGGIKIRIGDTFIDGSIRQTLENLRSTLFK